MRNTSATPMKNGGYWHALTEAPRKIPKAPPPEPSIDCGTIMLGFLAQTAPEWVEQLALLLKVSVVSLWKIGCGWATGRDLRRYMKWQGGGSWAFPMRNGNGVIVGIRLRTTQGEKIAVRGGRDGVFVPQVPAQKTAYIVEGPTDTAACLTLGVFGLGRPNCRGAIAHTQVTINRLGIERAIVVGEPDVPKYEDQQSPGIEGAKRLAQELQIPVASMVLPAKDMRKFLEMGGTRPVLESMEKHLVWKLPE
jgi:hypothetical protein